jgi:hypothetical protein
VWSEATSDFAECVTLVASIRRVEFKHCPKEANEVVHEIARFCYSCNWMDKPLALCEAKFSMM